MADPAGMAERVQGRLDRLDLTSEQASADAGMPQGLLRDLLAGRPVSIRGKRLVRLADTLSTSVSYLVGLDPDTPVPDEYLLEAQGELGLLAGDEEALLRAYRRLDMPSRAALLLLVGKIAPEPVADEVKPRAVRS